MSSTIAIPTIKTQTQDERLSELIVLKRLERPDAAFWEAFQHEFRIHQLSTLVGIIPWYERLGKAALKLTRKAGIPLLSATAVIAVSAFSVATYLQVAESETDESLNLVADDSIAPEKPVFVVKATKSTSLPIDPAQEFGPSPTYQISIMTHPVGSVDYRLNITPVTFTKSNASEELQRYQSSHGATIISTDRDF